MQEYLVYAICIFVPVGALMEYILRREGLALKYRIIIVTAAWAIIISFPILAGHMGMLRTLPVYLASIFALSWYFISVSQGPAWYLRRAGDSDNGEVYVSERLIDNTRIRTLGDIEDDMWFQENRKNSLVEEDPKTLVKADILPADSSVSENMNDTEHLVHARQNKTHEYSDKKITIDMINEQYDYIKAAEVLEESENCIAAIEDIVEGNQEPVTMNTDDLYTADKSAQNGVIKSAEANIATDYDGGDENVAQPAILNSPAGSIEISTLINQDTILENKEVIEIIENTEANSNEDLTEEIKLEDAAGLEEDRDQLAVGNQLDKNESAMEMEELTLSELIAGADQTESMEENISQTEDQKDEGALNTLHEENRLDFLIEKGFVLKQDQCYIEAIQLFRDASELTVDEELQFLLIMEAVNLYAEIGMYAQAEQVLFLSIGKAYTRTDIINEIDRQLSYIRLLSVELDRLGLANTPISEVPRMVKMSVAEILEI